MWFLTRRKFKGDSFTVKDAIAIATVFRSLAERTGQSITDIIINDVDEAKKIADKYDQKAAECKENQACDAQYFRDVAVSLRKLADDN